MNKFVKIFLIIAIVAGIGFSGWYFFLREPVLKVEFYGSNEVVKYLSGDGEYKENDKVVLVAEDREGYDFAFWLKDGKSVSTEKTYSFVMSEETCGRYTAQYNPREFEIFSPDGNVSESTAKTDEIVFVNVAFPKGFCVDEIYYVKQNTEERVDIDDSQFKMPPSNISIVVTIKEIDYVITYNLQGGSFDGNEIETYTINTPTFVLPTPKLDGYSFIGYTDEENSDPILNYEIKKGTYKDITVTANWELAPLSIKTNIEGEGSLDVSSSAFLGDEVSFVARPEEGYSLKEIYYIVDGSDEKVFIEDETFEMPNKPITIYVVFNKAEYTLTTETENGLVSLSHQTATAGEEITVTATPNTGYELVSCYYIAENTLTQVEFTSSFTMPANNVEVYVVFGLANYEINYVLNGGSLPQDYVDSYCLTDFVTLPIPTKVGHIFDGWFESESLTGQKVTSFDGSEVGGKTFYALFKPESIAVKFLNYDGSELLATSFDYGSTPSYTGSTPVKPSTERYNYTFSGWSPELTTLTESVEYTAVFTETLRKYMVVFAANGGVEVDTKEYTYEQVLGELPQTTQTGYTFEGWYTSLTNGVKATPETVIKGNTTFIAKWSVVNYTLTYALDGGSLQNPVNSYNIETPTFTLEKPTKTGYNFAGWIVNQGDEPNLDMVIEKGSTGNKTYTAVWQIQTFIVTWKNYDGSVIVTDSDVEYNTIPTYTGETPVRPSSLEYDYEFTGWFPTITNITSDATYTAVFISNLRTYTIAKGQIENGEISVAESAKVGEEVVVTVTPASGYLLNSLYYIDDNRERTSIEDNKFNMPTSDITIYADFRYVGPLYEIQLSGSVTGLGGISVSQTQAYEGETISLVFADDFVAPPGTELGFKYKELGSSSENYKIFGLSFTMPAYSVIIEVDIMDLFYTISKGSTTNGSFTVSTNASYYNDIITVTATPNTGYEVSRMYYIESGETAEVEFDTTFNLPANDITVYVEFVKSLYDISINEAEGESVVKGATLSHTQANYGETITITLPEDLTVPTGKDLVVEYVGISNDIEVIETIENLTFTMPDYDVEVLIYFVDIYYYVYTDPTTEGSYECNCTSQCYNFLVKVTVTPNEGYEVLRVYYNKVGDAEQVNIEKSSNTYNFIMPASDVIVYVEFGEITSYTITTVVEGDGSISCPTSCVGGKSFDVIISTTNADVDYVVVYYVGEVSNEKVIVLEGEKPTSSFPKTNTKMPRENITLYAEFYEPISYSITNGTLVESVPRAVPGREVKFIATANFVEFVVKSATYIGAYSVSDVISSTKLEDGSYEFSFVMSETGAVRVIFGFATHTITKDETINGSFSCPSTADYNSVVTVTATPDPGYEVLEMFYCKANGGGLEVCFDSTFTMPDYDIIIFVVFSKIENVYVITKNITGDSDVTCVETSYVGEEVNVTLYDQNEMVDCYEVYYVGKTSQTRVDLFDNYVSPIEILSLTFTMPEEDITLYAIASYSISFMLAGCTVEESINHAISGEEVTFVVTVDDENYVLQEASFNGAYIFDTLESKERADGKVEFSFVMPSESVVVHINYEAPTFNITKGETVNGSFTCPSTAKYNSKVTVTATPDPGYEVFQMYYYRDDDPLEIENAFSSTFTMPDCDVTICVEFVKASYTLRVEEVFGFENIDVTLSKSTANYGDTITVSLPEDLETPEGSCVKLYYISDDKFELYNAFVENLTFTMPSYNIKLHAYLDNSNYTISKGEVTNGSFEVLNINNKDIYVNATADSGYEVERMYYIKSGDIVENEFDFYFELSNADVTIYVEILPITSNIILAETAYSIEGVTLSAYRANTGDTVTIYLPEDFVLPEGKLIYLEHRNRFDSNTTLDSFTFTMPTADIDLYVEMYDSGYTISKGETTNGSFEVLNINDKHIYINATADSGYEVERMYYIKSGDTVENEFDSYFELPNTDVTIYVEILPVASDITIGETEYSIEGVTLSTYRANTGDTVTIYLPEDFVLPEGKFINLEYRNRLDFNTFLDSFTFTMPDEDIRLYVEMVDSEKSISKGETTNGSFEVLNINDRHIYINATADSGYEVERMYYIKSGDTVENEFDSYFELSNTDVTIYVEFSPVEYDITLAESVNSIEGVTLSTYKASTGDTVTIYLPEDFVLPTAKCINIEYNVPVDLIRLSEISKDIYDLTFTMPAHNIDLYVEMLDSGYGVTKGESANGSFKFLNFDDNIVRVYTTPDEGYEVERMYYIKSGDTVENEFDSYFSVTGHSTIYVDFVYTVYSSDNLFKIRVNDLSLGTAEIIEPRLINAGYNIKATPNANANFVGWKNESLDGELISTTSEITLYKGTYTCVYAVFEEKTKYNITKTNTSGGEVICQTTAYEGEEVTITLDPINVCASYEIHIVGENTNITATITLTTYTFTMPGEDVNITIDFNSNEPVAAYDISVAGVGIESCADIVCSESAIAGDDVVVQVVLFPDTEVYDIYYLTKDSKNIVKINLSYVGEDKTGTLLEADFEMPAEDIIIYVSAYVSGESLNKIDVVSVGNGFAHCVQFAYEYAEINLYIEPEEGYDVLRMYYVKTGKTEENEIDSTFTMPNSNITVYVEFAKIRNITEYVLDGGQTYCQVTALAGQEVVVAICEYKDYEISRMYYIKEGETEEIEFECSFVMPDSNISVYAEFTLTSDQEPPISTNSVGYFTNDYRLGRVVYIKEYPQEFKCELQAVALDGARFVEWRKESPDGEVIGTEETIIVENEYNYFAIFEEKPKYNITKTNTSGGEVICQDTAYEGEEVTIRLAPTTVTSGYEIHIVGENTNITTTITSTTYNFIMPSEDVSITVDFNNNEPTSLNNV